MQLDIFEHSRDVMLRNSAIGALRQRDAGAAARAIGELAGDYPDDALLPALDTLRERLDWRPAAPLDRESAEALAQASEGTIAAAQTIFGSEAGAWMSPIWSELAAAIRGWPFDAGNEALHAAPLLLRAGQWADACACLETIPSWRRLPAPLSWKIEAAARIAGMDTLWPFLAELAWMAPQRAAAVAKRVRMKELTPLILAFDNEFDGDGTPSDFAWFPAWVAIAHPQLADRLRQAQAGSDTAAERCARLALNLLALERQGRHRDLVECRKKLRDAHRGLFDSYMRSRSPAAKR